MCFFSTESRHQRTKSKENKTRKKNQALGKTQRKDQQPLLKSSHNTRTSDRHSAMAYRYFHPMSPMDGMPQYGPKSPGPNNIGPSQPTSTFTEIYIYPRSMNQVSFPVVDFNPKGRNTSSVWPLYHIALAPSCATPGDIEAELAPPGSGLTVMARLPDLKVAPLNSFRDASDIRCHSLQLEICEEASLSGNAPTQQPAERNGHDSCNYGCNAWKAQG